MIVSVQCNKQLDNGDYCEGMLEINVEKDYSYGADADGRRGGVAYFTEINSQECTCEYTSKEEDEIYDSVMRGIEDYY